MKKRNLFLAAMMFLCLVFIWPVSVQAASAWKEVVFDWEYSKDYSDAKTKPKKVGKYYIRLSGGTDDNEDMYCEIGSKKNKFETKIKLKGHESYHCYTNGSFAVIFDDADICGNPVFEFIKLNLKNGKYTNVYSKSFDYLVYDDSEGDYFYFHSDDGTMYSLNISTGKFKKEGKTAGYTDGKSKTKLLYQGKSSKKVGIYKTTSSGLKLVKGIEPVYFEGIDIVGNKIFYSSYNKSTKRIYIYSCNLNGKNRKKVASIKKDLVPGKISNISFYGADNQQSRKSCVIFSSKGQYIYTYKTKKLRKM